VRFLVDESTGRSVAAYLRREGHDVHTVTESQPGAADKAVLEQAVSEDRILITNDKDFGELVYRRRWEHRGILLLRLRDERSSNKVRMVKVVMTQVGDRLRDHYVVATEAGIRIRE